MKGFCLSASFPDKGVGWLDIPAPKIENPYDAILEPVAVSPCTSDVHSARANIASGGGAASNLILGKTGQKRPDIVPRARGRWPHCRGWFSRHRVQTRRRSRGALRYP